MEAPSQQVFPWSSQRKRVLDGLTLEIKCSRNRGNTSHFQRIPGEKVATVNINNLYPQFSSVAQSCPTLCDPMNRSTPGLPVHHQSPPRTMLKHSKLWITKWFVKEDAPIKHLNSSKIHIILDLREHVGSISEQSPQHKDILDYINLGPEFSEQLCFFLY